MQACAIYIFGMIERQVQRTDTRALIHNDRLLMGSVRAHNRSACLWFNGFQNLSPECSSEQRKPSKSFSNRSGSAFPPPHIKREKVGRAGELLAGTLGSCPADSRGEAEEDRKQSIINFKQMRIVN
ncbi:hypothetical protein Nepgr_000715 [Nepenthes gracilis]|uniref:Uncharacterized protein n=1 Tax=Nepenthes gracilis TaxID=150966 RepID=A0AAD3P3N6_NEPGR|nr:hypothetical protein Nepgr_000715 [Nepenthes gracilis]